MLGNEVDDADFDAFMSNVKHRMPQPTHYPACKSESSACRGGRLPCPTPDACRVAIEPRRTARESMEAYRRHRMWVVIFGVPALLALVGFLCTVF